MTMCHHKGKEALTSLRRDRSPKFQIELFLYLYLIFIFDLAEIIVLRLRVPPKERGGTTRARPDHPITAAQNPARPIASANSW
jgi:hypothetical protein